jgi:stage II sporulation protein R
MRNTSHHSKSQSHSFLFFTIGLASFIVLIGLSAIVGQISAVSVSANSGALIPEDAIRIRIIANSDNAADQTLKAEVRDEVAAYIASWGVMPRTHDEARQLIESKLPVLQERVNNKLRRAGVKYSGVVELANVSFPEKEFEGTSYTAGDYEALRITLGQGGGANWWCVLFPPLCLMAATAPDEQPKTEMTGVSGTSAIEKAQTSSDKGPEAKFFLWEMLKKLAAFLISLFS